MKTLATCTHGQDMFIAVKNACIHSGLDLKHLWGICMTVHLPPQVTKRDLLQDFWITCPMNMTIKNSSTFTALSTIKYYVPNPLL